nr:hypothetical protein CFP56_71731 [Quercus suber]
MPSVANLFKMEADRTSARNSPTILCPSSPPTNPLKTSSQVHDDAAVDCESCWCISTAFGHIVTWYSRAKIAAKGETHGEDGSYRGRIIEAAAARGGSRHMHMPSAVSCVIDGVQRR